MKDDNQQDLFEEEDDFGFGSQNEEKAKKEEKPEGTPKGEPEKNDGNQGEEPKEPKKIPAVKPLEEDIYEGLEDDEEYVDDDSSMFKIGICVLSIILVIICGTIVYHTDTGFIGEYKKNFMANIRAIDKTLHISDTLNIIKSGKGDEQAVATANPLDQTVQRETYMVPFENAAASKFAAVKEGIAIAKANYLAVYDTKGKLIWETTTSVVEPILKSEGGYIMLAEEKGKKICLYSDRKMIYAIDTENDILGANLSSNGDVVTVTKKEYYKGAIEVYNKEGSRIFSWSSGTDYVIAADISGSSRRVAASLLNTDSTVNSSVVLFDMNKTEGYASLVYPDTAVYNIEFVNETVNAAADNRIAGISVRGKVLWDKLFQDEKLIKYACDNRGNKLVLLEQDNIPRLEIYAKSGDKKQEINTEEIPDFIDILDNTILYNNNRVVVFGRPARLEKYAASMDIKDLKILDKSTCLIIYNNSIEFLKA